MIAIKSNSGSEKYDKVEAADRFVGRTDLVGRVIVLCTERERERVFIETKTMTHMHAYQGWMWSGMYELGVAVFSGMFFLTHLCNTCCLLYMYTHLQRKLMHYGI